MQNRLELAQQFVQEKLQQRTDIIAAWVGGSTARGEDTVSSDIDLVLLVSGEIEESLGRGDVDAWRDGVYIEAGFISQKEYSDLEMIMHDPFKSTHMNDALILYDPTGFVTQMQQAVRPLFMELQWLSKRLEFWVDIGHTQYGKLREACTMADPLAICAAMVWLIFSGVSVPLLRVGKTPSSSRGLLQLGSVSHTLYTQLCELEGSVSMKADDTVALQPLLLESLPLIDRKVWGDLPAYFTKKSEWLIRQGYISEAIHAMWMVIGLIPMNLSQTDDPTVKAKAVRITSNWLQQMGWTGQAVLATKVRLAETLVAEIEKEAANLPPSADLTAGTFK